VTNLSPIRRSESISINLIRYPLYLHNSTNLSVVDVKKEGQNYREVGGRRTSVEKGGYQLDELITYCICKIKCNLRVLDVKEGGEQLREVGGRRTSVEGGGGYQLDELDLIRYPHTTYPTYMSKECGR